MSDDFDAKDVISKNPLQRTLEKRYSMEFKVTAGEGYTKCPFHQDGDRGNLRLNDSKGLWFCDVCGVGGNVINFVMKKEGKDFRQACELLGAKPKEKKAPIDVSKSVPVKTYDYLDRFKNLVYQVCRYHIPNPEKEKGYEKTFRQRRPDDKGGWIWDMKDVSRVPYRLPQLMAAVGDVVNIVEGEKDADTLAELGFTATCNVGGAGKWLKGYGYFLEGREVAIWPDNDEPGRKHAQEVFDLLRSTAKNIRIMSVPESHKDVSEWVDDFPDLYKAAAGITAALDKAAPLYDGIELPVYSLAELEPMYRKQTQESKTTVLNLSAWLPSLQGEVRGLVPGELATFLAATGVGKTCLLQNLAIAATPLTTVLFELELPGELTFERFAACTSDIECATVFDEYAAGRSVDWKSKRPTEHVFVCPKAAMSCNHIEEIILKSELKTGRRPTLVLIDYIQLVQAMAKSRYERVSEVAERLKNVAKKTETIIFMASQIARPPADDDDDASVSLYDGKDSGSIENSCGLVIGAWREPGRPEWLKLKILKNTKGRPGRVIDCNFNGATMRITEQSKISDGDVQASARLPFNEN